MKNRCSFHRAVAELLLFFSTWRPSRYTVIYVSRATSSFSAFSDFSDENHSKSVSKNVPKKHAKKTPPGTNFGIQNQSEGSRMRRKVAKNKQKTCFWKGSFLDDFLGSIFSDFSRFWAPKMESNTKKTFTFFWSLFRTFRALATFGRFLSIFIAFGPHERGKIAKMRRKPLKN